MSGRSAVLGRVVAPLAAVAVLASCTSDASCRDAGPAPAAACADLVLHGVSYDERRPVTRPRILQEVGNATYPACNAAGACRSDPLGGFGATDVWRFHGLPRNMAVIGIRQGTHTYVVFVRVGVDPATVPDLR